MPMAFAGSTLADNVDSVLGLLTTAPSSSTPKYISLKNADLVEIEIWVKNGTTVTGSAITLKQATAVAGTSEKALAFTTYYSNTDANANSVMTKSTAASNTFTTDNTNSKQLLYKIPVRPAMLDSDGGFDCIRAGTGDAANTTVFAVTYNIVQKFRGNSAQNKNMLLD